MTRPTTLSLFALRSTPLPALIVALAIVALIAVMWLRIGLAPVIIIGGSALIGYAAWLATTYRRPADPGLVPLFLLAVALQVVHTGEEYLARFPLRFAEAFSTNFVSLDAFAVAVMVGFAAVWILTALGLLRGNPYANYLLWFFVVGPGLVNAVAHLSFPFIIGSPYFPGLYTVLLPTIPTLFLLRRLTRRPGRPPAPAVPAGD